MVLNKGKPITIYNWTGIVSYKTVSKETAKQKIKDTKIAAKSLFAIRCQ